MTLCLYCPSKYIWTRIPQFWFACSSRKSILWKVFKHQNVHLWVQISKLACPHDIPPPGGKNLCLHWPSKCIWTGIPQFWFTCSSRMLILWKLFNTEICICGFEFWSLVLPWYWSPPGGKNLCLYWPSKYVWTRIPQFWFACSSQKLILWKVL